MAGNTFGERFRVTTFGESHGRAVGAVIDGCPAGLAIGREDIQRDLDRRKPGQSGITTSRGEEDRIEILSGIFQGRALGTPIALMVENRDIDSSPYEEIKDLPRPGHADLSYQLKYGHRDYRGGGRSSGRETVGRVAGGAIARKLLSTAGIGVWGHTVRVGKVKAGEVKDLALAEENPIRCADRDAAPQMIGEIEKARKRGDSVGGVIEVVARDLPPGLGEPVFDKLDADVGRALMSIGSVKGVEIGSGFRATESRGSENNDQFYVEGSDIKSHTNNSGGVLGGISYGMPLVARVAIKPTPSIFKSQKTVNMKNFEQENIEVKGRHDPCIVPRVLPVCEAMVALTLADHMLRNGNINPSRV